MADRDAVLTAVAARVPSPERPVLVVVDGADGAGKTRFAEALARTLTGLGRVVVRASIDDFHHPRAHRHAHGRTAETVWTRSFDIAGLRRELIDPWRAGPGSAYRRRWHDLVSDAYVDEVPVPVPDRGVLLVDGVFAQRPELADAWDLAVWLEVPAEIRVARLAGRDGTVPDVADPDQQRYLGAQRIYREACDPVGRADVVVDHADWEHPVMLRAVADLALEVAGGVGFFRRSPLERAYRDARGGPFHPHPGVHPGAGRSPVAALTDDPRRCEDLGMDPAEEFREVAGRLGVAVHGVTDEGWDVPSPVEGWAARDVVRHLVEWFPGFLAGGSDVRLSPTGSVDDDPVGTWDAFAASVQAVLDDPATAERSFSNPHTGDLPLAAAISQFFTADVFMHTWDLARATGQDDTLDADRCRVMVEGMAPYDELLRSSGQYGPRVPVADDADPQTRLLGFIGRDPDWRAR